MSNTGKTIAGFVIGAAVGVAVGYFLNSDKKDEYVDALKEKAEHWKEKATELSKKVKSKIGKKADELEEVATS